MTDEEMKAVEERLERVESEVEVLRQKAEECRRWEAEHDGRINAYWEQQFAQNADMKERQQNMADRITSVEKKVMYISGFAAAVGGVIGGLAARGIGT